MIMTDRKTRRGQSAAPVVVTEVIGEDEVFDAGNSTPVTVLVADDQTPEIDLAAFEASDNVIIDSDLETRYIPKSAVRAWAMWDWSTQPFNSIIITFVFIPLYLTSLSFLDPRYAILPPNDPVRVAALDRLTAGIGAWVTIAGIFIALLAPVLGQRADATGKRKRWLFWANLLLVLIMFALFFVRAEPRYFMLGAALVAFGSVIDTVANVNYNALLSSVSTPKTVGRVSGFGWGSGYMGGIVALIIVIILQFSNWFGMDTSGGLPFRLIALGCAIWAIIFGWPLYRYVPEPERTVTRTKMGIVESYKSVFEMIKDLFFHSRTTFWFLIASAIYRDGLAGIFTFGAVIAAVSFGFSTEMVMLFGVAANLIAGISTMLVGRLDDLWGARRVIQISLLVLLASGIIALIFHNLGAPIFWIFGLILCATVGPAQSASRSFLARVTPPGHESEIFGLYATTGKAASFLSAGMWTIFIAAFGATIWGLVGILLVIAIGLGALMLLVRDDGLPAADVGITDTSDPTPIAL